MNFLYRVRCAAARFMYGRSGFDQLCWALLLLNVLLDLAAGFAHGAARMLLHACAVALIVLAVWRALSRNVTRRRAENLRFVNLLSAKTAALRAARQRGADKAHKYVKCGCGAWCRVPRNVGTVELMCPRCGEKRIVKT